MNVVSRDGLGVVPVARKPIHQRVYEQLAGF